MLDSYKVLNGDKTKLNGEGFERLREESSHIRSDATYS